MIKSALILFFVFISFSSMKLNADDSYPFNYLQLDYHEGGQMVVSDLKAPKPSSYFFKSAWAGDNELVWTWKGIARKNANGGSFGGVRTLAVYPAQNSVLMIWKTEGHVYISNVNNHPEIISTLELIGDWSAALQINVRWLGLVNDNSYLFIVNESLFICSIDSNGKLKIKLQAKDVSSAVSFYNTQDSQLNFAYLLNTQGWGEVYFVDYNANSQLSARLRISDIVNMSVENNHVCIIMTTKLNNHSWIYVVDKYNGIINQSEIEANGERVKVIESDGKHKIAYLAYQDNVYSLNITDFYIMKTTKDLSETTIPQGFIEPLGMWSMNREIIVMFRNGLITFDLLGKIKSLNFMPLSEIFVTVPDIQIVDNYFVLSSPTGSIVLEKKYQPLWYFNRFLKTTGKIFFPALLIFIILVVWQLYNRQRKLLNTILGLPSSGYVFYIDKKGRLLKANDQAKEILRLTENIALRKMFQYYCVHENLDTLKELVEKTLAIRDAFTQKINININDNTREWYCTIMPLRSMAGNFKGFVLTGVDITEELEKKRLSNWAQLAHDMQTNLSTIRLNAELLELGHNPGNIDRRNRIVHQVLLLLQKVRDIVVVGRTDALEKQVVNAADVCNEARMEFDYDLFPNVSFVVNAESFSVVCDKQKMIRAMRNAIENGIRALQGAEGTITISSSYDTRYAYFSVKDTGIGMDEKIKKKILTPYFTTAKKEGGSGIGTMIMQYVMELHGGEIMINSEKNKGSEFIFCIPNELYGRTLRNR